MAFLTNLGTSAILCALASILFTGWVRPLTPDGYQALFVVSFLAGTLILTFLRWLVGRVAA